MVRIKADPVKKRLYIELEGFIKASEADAIMNELIVETGKLKSGFDIVNDLSNYSFSDGGAVETLRSVMDFLRLRGVGRVVRIKGKSHGAMVQFLRASQGSAEYPITYVETLEEAEKVLA